ncbi:MAG: esterase [Xanthobacteraceae bacterium]|nr:esterase [Xanthobacteraceae bacterium]
MTIALAACGAATTARAEPILLREMGSFFVGGRIAVVSDRPKIMSGTPGVQQFELDPNGEYWVEQMYVQYFKVEKPRGRVPIILWHGGAMTGVFWESTPDGRPGWVNYFLRRGWDVYNVDGVERGRSGWAMYPEIWPAPPEFMPRSSPAERTHWRIGAGRPAQGAKPDAIELFPGSQFPVEAYDAFVKGFVPRWYHTGPATIKAFLELVDRVCPCVVISHSQSGAWSFDIAKARPDKVRALIAIESATPGSPGDLDRFSGMPIMWLLADFIDTDPQRVKAFARNLAFLKTVSAAGGLVDVVRLPELGIRGNTHFVMSDRNSDDVAGVVHGWLAKHGLHQ